MFCVSNNGKNPAFFGQIEYAIMDMREHLKESGLILSLEMRHDGESTYVTLEEIMDPSDDVYGSIPYSSGKIRVIHGKPVHKSSVLNYPERRKAYWIGVFRTMLDLD